MEKTQREYVLREQLKAIQRELGEMEGGLRPEVQDLREKLQTAPLTDEARDVAKREVDRLETINPASPEYTVARTYVEWILELPWTKSTEDRIDIKEAKTILDQDHYDLERVKDRILDFLAVRKLKENMKSPILCFVGPPGVGKTSLGQSIARAMQRQFIRMSLGSVRDEAEIRGHRRTYIGALPGQIIQMMKKAGTRNPIFMLDEIEKMSMDFRGDPSAALLEVLDPEQNYMFVDHYLDVEYDLSQVFFIATANVLHTVPAALQDRMEVIRLSGYTEIEKLEIAKRFLVRKQMEQTGVEKDQIEFTDEGIMGLVQYYTREAGVRNLEREIGNVCRKVARQVVNNLAGTEKKKLDKYVVASEKLPDLLGPQRFRDLQADKRNEIGAAVGLAWTEVGGQILTTEATLMEGKGKLTITGKLGDVMQESAQAAMSYIRSRAHQFGLPRDFYRNLDVHLHIPEGAIPKDGPSAGITIATTISSALTRIPVRADVAMTGEITLRGKVLPIGGLKEKLLAAHRHGIYEAILPVDNQKDLPEIPEIIRKEMKLHFVENMDQVLKIALEREVVALPMPVGNPGVEMEPPKTEDRAH
jgi:ATP-dependent Lon protease